MRSSQVYQPTTTTLPYESKARVPSFLAHSSATSAWSRLLVLILAVVFAIMGLIMVIVGATWYDSFESTGVEPDNSTAYITILCLGILLEIVAIAAIVFYYRNSPYKIPCCPGKIAHIRKRFNQAPTLNGQMRGSQEPVRAQYCPPAAPSSSPPPPFADVSEQQRLMGEKQDFGDDTDRILEEDPRIVLTPLKSHEDC